jgi:hypothetical protein
VPLVDHDPCLRIDALPESEGLVRDYRFPFEIPGGASFASKNDAGCSHRRSTRPVMAASMHPSVLAKMQSVPTVVGV